MIKRYQTKDMQSIWSDENKYRTWLKVELAVTEVLVEDGIVPKESFDKINDKASFSVDRIQEIEETTNHDVIAFLTNLAENIGPDSRYIHMGMTSSDLLDTSMALQCKQAGTVILEKLINFKESLREKAKEHKETFQIGRSHGVHAEPITFGLKLALWSEEIDRNIERWKNAIDTISFGKISGAVGNYAHMPPKIEAVVCEKVGLEAANASTQTLQRDRHAHFMTTLAIIAGTLEKIATEIRALQKTEMNEVIEPFAKGQKGSSAMPHKRNPVLTENLTGLSRLVRSAVLPALENVSLWHERDISHSSVERMIFPDVTITLDFALARLSDVVKNLLVYPDNMMKNLEKLGGLVFSQRVLLALTQGGMDRETSYEIVQRNAKKVWEKDLDFLSELKSDSEVKKIIKEKELESLFDIRYHTKNIDKIFTRVFDK
mgnify:CR=1 FL=1